MRLISACTMASTPTAAAKSRVRLYNAAVCASRRRADSVCSLIFAVSVLITRPTISRADRVTRYCMSVMANEYLGGINRKSKAIAPKRAVKSEGPRPRRMAEMTTARR